MPRVGQRHPILFIEIIMLGYSAGNRRLDEAGIARQRRPHRRSGFTLVEVLVALVLLLIGAYVALRVFPSGFAAIERARIESLAARLADQEIQRWRLAAGSLPEAIVWAQVDVVDDSTVPPTLSLSYNVDYDPNGLTPNAGEPFSDANNNGVWDTGEPYTDLNSNGVYDRPHPNWQPDSAYRPRTIIGEVLPVGDVTESVPDPNGVDPNAVGIRVPLCRLRFGPLEHLYAHNYDYDGNGDAEHVANPPGYDALFIYTTEYERVDNVNFLIDATDPAPKDWGRYYVDYDAGTISFDLVPDYMRRFRVEFTYLIDTGPGARAERRYEMWDVVTLIDVAAGEDTVASPKTLWPELGAPPVNFAGIIPLSERVHQAFIMDNDDWPLNGPGYFRLIGDTSNPIAEPSASILFDPGDAGRTVNVDYKVRDWQILVEERVPDDRLEIQLVVAPVKSAGYINPPRQPGRDRIIPGDDDMVIVIDTEDGSRFDYVDGAPASSDYEVNFQSGLITLSGNGVPPEPAAGGTYRVYYRSDLDWSIQPMKAAAQYSIVVGATAQPGYRFAVWDEPANPRDLEFGPSEVAKSVVANYYMYDNGDPVLISGELHQVVLDNGRGLVRLAETPAWGDIRVQGASMRARVLWAGRGRTDAVAGQASPESWRQVIVETFLRRQ
ncbi:MAG: prepilin-type N-terminal cleavage/methylation domain-containing protein [Armatimonadota bacterium]|nr:MAG: prepilin-type N-terminal cleavage/methylation domain-containing protein [Armatimonadota bacterium]